LFNSRRTTSLVRRVCAILSCGTVDRGIRRGSPLRRKSEAYGQGAVNAVHIGAVKLTHTLFEPLFI